MTTEPKLYKKQTTTKLQIGEIAARSGRDRDLRQAGRGGGEAQVDEAHRELRRGGLVGRGDEQRRRPERAVHDALAVQPREHLRRQRAQLVLEVVGAEMAGAEVEAGCGA